MESGESASTLERIAEIPKESIESRETAAEFNNIQDGGHVVSSVVATTLQQNPLGLFVTPASVAQVVPASNGLVQKNLPALQNTTKPIPASVFSYRFASPTSNQTPYYVSSDIVLSGGIAQQTRRRIVHNEVERRRKDKINNWILKLADVVPQCSWGKQSKNIVLEKTVEYINQVNTQLKELSDLQQREQKLAQEVQLLKTRLGTTTKENKLLRDLLKKNSIPIPRKIPTTTTTDSTSSGTVDTDTPDDAIAMMTTEVPKSRESPTAAVTTASRPPQVTSQTTVISNATQPTTATTAVLNHLPITSASVAKEQSKRESIAYVAPFIITTNPISAASSTASVFTPVTTCPTVQLPTTSVVQNSGNNLGQLELNQPQGNISSLSNPNPSFNPPVVQFGNKVPCSVTQQPLQTVSTPVSSASQVLQSQAGYSRHSVAAIMKVALQPGTSISPISVVNAVPLVAPATGHNSAAILNLQPAVISSCAAVPSAVQMSTPLVAVPVPNSLGNQHAAAGVSNTVVTQSTSLPAFYVTATPNQSITVSKISQNNESTPRPKASTDASKNQGGCKAKKGGPANKGQKKSGVNTSRTQNTNRNSQNKPLLENKATSASNKRGAAHLTVRDNTRMAKRASTCGSQEPPGNISICQPQPEIMTIQTFNVNSLIPGITTQVSVPANTMPTRVDCGKPTVQVSSIGMSQAGQIPRLSHSIASLAGLPQSMEQTQTSSDLQQHQQVSQLGSGSLSFSAESLLASSEVVLPNIPHITTASVNSDSNPNQQSSLTMAVAPSIHSTPSEQGHAQSFSNYSAEALIGGNELMGDSVMTQESQLQTRPSRTTYSDFSAESLIGSSDLNSSLSYAIDNLISSRSDANYNSTAMVSVNPNLLHSVKSNVSHDASTNNPLRALAAMPDLVEQKATAPSSQSAMLFSGPTGNSAYRMSPPNSAASQFTFVTHNSTRRQTDGVTPQQGTGQAVNSTNNVSVPSTSFLKHSVDSITSSFYAVSNAGSSFSLGSNSAPGIAFQGQAPFGLEPFSSSQLSFGSMTNPFSPTRSFFNHGSTMGSFV